MMGRMASFSPNLKTVLHGSGSPRACGSHMLYCVVVKQLQNDKWKKWNVMRDPIVEKDNKNINKLHLLSFLDALTAN